MGGVLLPPRGWNICNDNDHLEEARRSKNKAIPIQQLRKPAFFKKKKKDVGETVTAVILSKTVHNYDTFRLGQRVWRNALGVSKGCT